MKLFLNDIELDADKEHELISDSEFGFDVDIVYERDILIETLKGESIDLYESLGCSSIVENIPKSIKTYQNYH